MTTLYDIPLVDVIEVTPIEDYKLRVTFEDGASGVFDVSPYLDRGVFKALRDVDVFEAVHVANGSVAWPGDIDLAPERLYTDMLRA